MLERVVFGPNDDFPKSSIAGCSACFNSPTTSSFIFWDLCDPQSVGYIYLDNGLVSVCAMYDPSYFSGPQLLIFIVTTCNRLYLWLHCFQVLL